ncbi:uncharacterized protein LOC134665838 [Cydia fagiglandana]|uniref:uncharacterized protein LOC134665838 n=1 Tax=Cydia fagiglandana TaxID=1458189 RepID=UPI002FEE3FBA
MMDPSDETHGRSSGPCAFTFLESTHGGRILIRGGYRHYFKRTNKLSGSSVWNCHNKNSCKGFVVINATETSILRDNNDSCVPDYESIDIEKEIIELKKKVTTDYKPIPALYKQHMKQFMREEYADKLPPFHTVRDALYKARQKLARTSKFETFEDVAIPVHLSENFVCVHDCDIIIFITDECKQWMAGLKTFFIDGTFKIVPEPFIQLYTIHGDLGSDENCTKVVPCVYALLPNKRQTTYERMFQLIKENIPSFEPDHIKIDFEIAAANAIKCVYPTAKISGCFFHYKQAVYTNADSLGATSTREGCSHVAKCAAIAHLPAMKIHEAWMSILEMSPRKDEILSFNDYMLKQWVKVDMIHMVSCYGHRHRTNNVVESWHRKMNNRIHNNSSLLFFISQLKEEAVEVNFVNMQNEMRTDVFRKRNRMYISMDRKIEGIVNNYLMGSTNIEKCVRLLSVLKYK